VHTWVEEVRSRSITLGYEACHAESGQRLATGWTKHICVDREGRVVRLPEEMLHGHTSERAQAERSPAKSES
jgi:acyl-CoA thioesterase FadM